MMLTRFFLLLVATALSVGACSPSNSPNQPKQHEEIKNDGKEIAQAAIKAFVKKSGADTSWMTSIEKIKASYFQSLYTVDLERLWLVDQPIVFVGALRNVATETEADYSLLITASDIQFQELRLEILCAKSKVSTILARVKSDKESFSPGGVVITANITKIKSAIEPEKEGIRTVIYGQGRCVDIAYLGDTMDLMFSLGELGSD
ncbi:MAG: hypothetical protein ABL869_08285 [Candidatus Nitrotoga sp.]